MAEIMTAKEAVERYIHTGTQVCWGGFSYTRRPFTIAREVIRQKDRIKHHFCPRCGCAPFSESTDPQGNPMAAINARCLENLNLSAIKVVHWDGLHH